MQDQFIVPQFLDTEDKILGPITARQFVELLVVLLVDAVLYKLLSFVAFLVIGIPLFAIGGVVAFLKVNGQPFHFFVLNLIQSFRKPKLRVWNKKLSSDELKASLKKAPEPPALAPVRKTAASSSRLRELTLLVNTGGSYRPDKDIPLSSIGL